MIDTLILAFSNLVGLGAAGYAVRLYLKVSISTNSQVAAAVTNLASEMATLKERVRDLETTLSRLHSCMEQPNGIVQNYRKSQNPGA